MKPRRRALWKKHILGSGGREPPDSSVCFIATALVAIYVMRKALFILDQETFPLIYPLEEQAEISRLVDIIGPPQTAESILERLDLLYEVEIIFSGWGPPLMDQKFLDSAPKLEAVFYGGGTVRKMVTSAFWERNILLCNAAAANAVPVSEFTLASIILSLKLAWRFAAANRGLVEMPSRFDVPGAVNSTVGVISLGMIGRLVCERLRSLDVTVIVFDPFITEESAAELGVELVSLKDVFRRSEVVTLHAPWLEETVGMIRKEHFQAMKPNSTFINTARGALVNEPEMIEVLSQRPELHAVIDVTFPEPPEEGSLLYSLPNVTLTPHIAGSVNNECGRMGSYMVNELRRYLSGRPMQWRLSKEKAATLA